MADSDTPKTVNPQSKPKAALHTQRGWQSFARHNYQEAQAEFRKALDLEPNNADILYALALALKSEGSIDMAVEIFKKALVQIEKLPDQDHASMLKRLTKGQINQILFGEWSPRTQP